MTMSEDLKIVQPTIKRAPARARGPLSSEDYNDFQDQAYTDVVSLTEAVNALSNQITRMARGIDSDTQNLKRHIASLEERLAYNEFTSGKRSVAIDRYIDLHDTSSIIFPNNLLDSRRAEFKAQFGEIYLPANGVENKFYNFSLRTNQIVLAPDFEVDVTSTFDKLDGNGTKNFEYGGDVNTGTPENAFNGINESAWIRTVSFPLESPIEEVECQVTVVVPAGVSAQANLLELVPYPEGVTDIVELSTASDLSSAFVSLDSFVPVNNFISTRYHFSPRDVEQLRIRLKARNWREINGKKVFSYGLQEVGLKLVDYNKNSNSDQIFGDNVTAVLKLQAPREHAFNTLYRIDPNPNFFLEDASNRHVRLRIGTSPDFSNVIWDSNKHVLPQHGVATGVALNGATTVYAIYTMQFVKNSGGYQSPFPVGTTPTIKGLGLLFTATQTTNN